MEETTVIFFSFKGDRSLLKFEKCWLSPFRKTAKSAHFDRGEGLVLRKLPEKDNM